MIRVPCDPDTLERLAFHASRDIEFQGETAHLRIGDIEYVADVPLEATC